MRINVTAEDIETGIKHHCTACPIALAGSRALQTTVVVSHYALNAYEKGRFLLPDKAMDFIVRFDQELPVEPFGFDLQ